MKVKSFLLTALAASMTFVACDNKDDEMGQLDNTPKSVSIDLSNVIPVTRGAGQEVEDNSKVSLTDLQVFFTDGLPCIKEKQSKELRQPTTSAIKVILTTAQIRYSIFYLLR